MVALSSKVVKLRQLQFAGRPRSDDPDHSEAVTDDGRRLRFAGCTAIVADDDLHVRRALMRTLARFGIYVTLASSRADLRDVLTGAGAFDIAIVDLWFDDGFAFDEIGTLAEREPRIPVIVITGLGEEDMRQAREHGASVVLPKPVSSVDLFERVEVLLPAARAYRADVALARATFEDQVGDQLELPLLPTSGDDDHSARALAWVEEQATRLRLSPSVREVLVQIIVFGRKQSAIAEAIGVTVKVVQNHYYTALTRAFRVRTVAEIRALYRRALEEEGLD